MKRFALALIALALIVMPRVAEAHVLVTDTTGSTGAILHLTPDDDPIAGEPSELFFDLQDSRISKQTHSFNLQIIPENGAPTLVPITVSGSSITTMHAFPTQGLYEIVLSVEPVQSSTGQKLRFEYDQRISRGILADGKRASSDHAWAEISTLLSICGLLVLAILGYNRRRDITSHSK